jgi:hypothetical protein
MGLGSGVQDLGSGKKPIPDSGSATLDTVQYARQSTTEIFDGG